MSRLKIGLVGAGTMGALHARVIATGQRTTLGWVSDPSAATGRVIAERYGVPYLPIPDLGAVDAVVVAAPTQVHHRIGLEVLRSGRPLLMEKPLANDLGEVDQLLTEAQSLDLPLMCGLLERFNPAVRTAFELSRTPIHFRSIRHSPMTARIQTGVAGDLLIHDLDLALRLFGAAPSAVMSMTDSSGRSDRGVEDVSEALLQFGSGELASLSASRRSQRKIRSMMITEGDRLIEVDLLRQDVTIYRHVFESPTDDELGYRQQTIIDVPVLRHHGEPLTLQLDHFVDVIEGVVDHALERATIRPPHEVLDAIVTQERVP
jgi:predicted dehydrogenase